MNKAEFTNGQITTTFLNRDGSLYVEMKGLKKGPTQVKLTFEQIKTLRLVIGPEKPAKFCDELKAQNEAKIKLKNTRQKNRFTDGLYEVMEEEENKALAKELTAEPNQLHEAIKRQPIEYGHNGHPIHEEPETFGQIITRLEDSLDALLVDQSNITHEFTTIEERKALIEKRIRATRDQIRTINNIAE